MFVLVLRRPCWLVVVAVVLLLSVAPAPNVWEASTGVRCWAATQPVRYRQQIIGASLWVRNFQYRDIFQVREHSLAEAFCQSFLTVCSLR